MIDITCANWTYLETLLIMDTQLSLGGGKEGTDDKNVKETPWGKFNWIAKIIHMLSIEQAWSVV